MERGVRDRESERETGREKARERAREGEKVELIINSLSIVFQSFLFFTVFASKLKKNSQIFEFLSWKRFEGSNRRTNFVQDTVRWKTQSLVQNFNKEDTMKVQDQAGGKSEWERGERRERERGEVWKNQLKLRLTLSGTTEPKLSWAHPLT